MPSIDTLIKQTMTTVGAIGCSINRYGYKHGMYPGMPVTETEISFAWECVVDMPRRSKNGSKLPGTDKFRGAGETPEEAAEKAILYVGFMEREYAAQRTKAAANAKAKVSP